jgi:autotransporter-associated beta strand protein
LEVAIGGTSAPTQLIWGASGTNNLTFSFVSDGGVLLFGSTTSAAELQFDNPVSLGNVINGGFYDRIVSVATNATDAFGLVLPSALGGDSTATFNGDYTNMTGVISEPNYQFGFVKAGAGILQLSGTNTYQGSTSITGGILAVSADANLGAAPSAAYPLVTVPDSVTGSTLTPGARWPSSRAPARRTATRLRLIR